MSILDTIVPKFTGYRDYPGAFIGPIPLGEFLYDATYRNEAEQICEMDSKEDRDMAKTMLPAIMGGCYAESRAENVAVERTGLMFPEFDRKENLRVEFLDLVMNVLPQIQYIAYAGLSVSRQGAFCVVPIPKTGSFQTYYKAITDDFAKYGLVVDQKVNFPKALRGYSYNDNTTSFYNPNAKQYTKQAELPKPKPFQKITGKDAAKVQRVVDRIVREKLNVTDGYDNWVGIGLALAIAFNESGRQAFHQLSAIHSEYDAAKTDAKYSSFLNKGYSQVGLGTFYHICGRFKSVTL